MLFPFPVFPGLLQVLGGSKVREHGVEEALEITPWVTPSAFRSLDERRSSASSSSFTTITTITADAIIVVDFRVDKRHSAVGSAVKQGKDSVAVR